MEPEVIAAAVYGANKVIIFEDRADGKFEIKLLVNVIYLTIGMTYNRNCPSTITMIESLIHDDIKVIMI